MKRIWIIILCCLLLTACGPQEAETQTPAVTAETPEVSTETTPASDLQPKLTFPYEINGYGFDGDLHLDSGGIYYLYRGGEMCITTFHQGRGLMEKGIAVFLYVDGRPQPFRTEAEPEDAYMHMIYPKNNQETFTDLYFTPLTGEAGEVKEVCIMSIANPDYFITDGLMPFALRPYCSVVRMKYDATPPECALPAVQERLLSWSIDYTERKSQWTQEGEILWNFRVNDRSRAGSTLKNIADDEPLTLGFELWGSTEAEFGVVFYVDHQPVSVSAENIMLVQAVEGQRLIIEAQVDISDFDGSSVVYAVLVPRNYRSGNLGISCELNTSGIFYLMDEEG